MPIYSVQGPDGRTYDVEGPAGASEVDIISAVKRQISSSAKPKEPEKIGESGFVPAAKAGLASLKSDVAALAGRTGIMDTAAAEKYIQEQEAYKKKTFKPTEEGWTDAPWTKFKETLGGSLPYMAAPVAAGIGAATLPLSGTAATLAGLGATGLTSAAQFTGSNLSRQMDEGKKLGETDIGAAAAASIPQAALDIIGLKMLPGVRGIFAAVGKEVPEKVLLEATKQTTGRIAKDYALATGKAMGTEGLTEAGQQVFERLQAGLNITDANARSEYFDNFVAGAVLGGALAPVGRYVERGQEQKVQEAKRLAEIPKLRAEEEAQIEKERLAKQSPEYAQKVLADYQAGEKQKADLKAQIRKIEKGSPTETADTEFNKSINAELKTLAKTLTPLAQEYNRVQPIIKQLAEKERLDKMSPEEFMLDEVLQNAKEKTSAPTGGRMKGQVYAPEPAVKAAPDPAAANYLAQQIGLARAAGQFDLGTYADYLMQDPKMAARVVAERPDLPEEFGPTSLGPKAFSLSSNDAGNLFAGLKMRLKDREKSIRTETAKAMEQRRQDLLAQKQTPEIENQLADLDEYMAGRLEEGQGYLEPTFEYLNPLFEKALGGNEVIKVNKNLKATRTAPFVRKSIQALTAKLEEARKAKDVAFRSGSNNAKEAAEVRYDDVLDALNAYETEPSTGEMTKGLKAGPAETQQNAIYAKEVLSAQRARDEALGKIEDVTERLRKGDVLGKEKQPVRTPATGKVTTEAVPAGQGVAASTQQSLVNQAERSRAAYITAVLQEAATHRRALGKGDLSVDEALKAASKMDTVFKDWINRSTAKPLPKYTEKPSFEKVVVQPAQMRANKVVRQAVMGRKYNDTPPSKAPPGYDLATGEWVKRPTKTFAKLEAQIKPVTNVDSAAAALDVRTNAVIKNKIKELTDKGTLPFVWEFVDNRPPIERLNQVARLSDSEVQHFKAQLDTVLKDLEDIQTTVTRETPLLKQQFATTEAKKTAEAKGETAQTLGGELRRQREYVGTMLDKALTRNPPEEIQNSLERAKEIIDNGKASTTLLDAAQNQAERILRGEDLGKQTYTRREIAEPGKQVVEAVGEKLNKTRMGVRGTTYRTSSYEAALAPEGSALRELQDAIKLSERTAQEGEAVGEGGAGQGQLFPETRKDLGYLRASPANFANSPKIKPIWEAIAKARELKNKLDSKDAVNKRRQEASVQTLDRIKSAIDVFNKDTAFFTKDMEKWSDEELARVFVGVSDDYLSTEDKTLSNRVAAVSKLLAKAPGAEKRLEELSLQEEKRLNAAHEQIMSKYFTEDERERIRYLGGASDKAVKERKAKVDDAIKVLVAGNRLNDVDNQLLSFMQDTNASVRKAADALKAQIAPWQKAIVQIENTLRNTRTLTKAQRAQVDAAYKVQQTRNKYQEVMHKALAAAKKNIAENTVSGPQIEIITRQLKGAKTRLEKVMADIPKAEQEFATGPMYQSKNLLKFRQMFKQISDLEEDLMLWQETKAEEIESAIAATQAVMDRDVQAQLKRLEMLETQLADMRGEEVTTRTYAGAPAYPFALRRLEVETAAQRKELEASQKEANQFAKDMDVVKAQVQKTARQVAQELDLKLPGIKFTKREGTETSADREAALENINDTIETLQTEREDTQARLFDEDLTDEQRNKLADTLIENKKKLDLQAKKRTGVLGRVEPIVTKEDRKIEEQRKAAMDAEFAQLESENRQNKRDAQIKLFDDELADLYKEFEEYPGPTEKRALSNIIGDETKPDKDRQLAIAKYMTLNSIESVEAQREVFMESKPRKKQKPATTQSTAALSAQKPLRLGKITGLLDEDAFVTGSDFRSISGTGKTQVDFDSLFRTSVKEGSGMRADSIKRVVDDITEGWENMPEVVIVDDESGLPEDIYKQAVASNKIGKIPGVYDPNTKIVYLVATNLHTAKDVGLTVAHEVTGHFGLRELLGENYSSTMQSLYKGNSLVKERTDANMAKDSKLSQDVAVEEVLADMAETGPYANTQITNALRRLFFAIKRALYDFLDIANVSDSEVKQLVANARKFVKKGTSFDRSTKNLQSTINSVLVNVPTKPKVVYYKNLQELQNSNPNVYEQIKDSVADNKGSATHSFGEIKPTSGLSRRQFLKGTAATVGALQLPAIKSSMTNEEIVEAVLNTKSEISNFLDATINALPTNITNVLEGTYADDYIGMGVENSGLENAFDLQDALFNQGEDSYTVSIIEDAVEERGIQVLKDMQQIAQNSRLALVDAVNNATKEISKTTETKAETKPTIVVLTDRLYTNNQLKQAIAKEMVIMGAPIKGLKIDTGEKTDKSGALFRTESRYTNPEMEKNSGFVNTVIARDKSWWDKLKANLTGISFETQLVDRFAGFERLAKYMEPLKGTQMLMYLRQYDQRMSLVSDAVANGAPIMAEKIRKDGRKEVIIETAESANIVNVVKILKDAKQYIGNGEAVSDQFTLYLAALRTDRVGVDALNFGKDVTQEKLNAARRVIENNKPLFDIFEAARKEYNAYNRNLIRFVQNTGAISKELADRLASTNDYIPFYRERGGVAELVIGGENPVRIGSIAEQPYLHGLLGGEDAILNFMTSSVQNTNMLIDMGMRNLATKNAVFELVDLKAAKFIKKGEGSDVVKFKVDGEDRYAVIATEKVTIGGKVFETGVPADILVKGMEGIPTQMPALFRAMAVPSQLLRKAVVLSPLYMARQLFRDSLAAPILSGADFAPVIGALRQIGNPAKRTLEKRGITGGQVFTGSAEDISKILRDITEGKPGWMQALGKFEAMGMEADALTRRAQYNSYIEQGLSEMEATLMALESMNFNKRGASPSVHVANSLIPFFNAQIQGLNVMYKAMTGKLPFSDKLKIQEKMLTRGAMMAGASLLYAAMMEDDEAYKNATPDQKYGNWFVRIPGLDEPVRVPVPFEIGYIFKALPEALYNSMVNEHGGEEAVKAFKQILLQTVPGGSSYGIPQALKPAIEAGLGKSFYTGRDILSAREKELLPEEQFRANTSELAKSVGKAFGISPIVFEQLVSGYTGTMGLAFLHAVSIGVPPNENPEQAVKRLSEYPIVGGAFQPNDAGGIVNAVYERMNEDLKVKHTFDKLVAEGRTADAKALLQRRGNEYMESELANEFKSNMNMLTQAQRAIEASNMSGEEKRKQLDKIRKIRIGLANMTREMSDKTIHLTGFP